MTTATDACDVGSRTMAAAADRDVPVLGLHGVSRVFGGRLALAPLTLELEARAVCLVEGSNGAGKTTLLRLAAGLLRPSAGTRVCPGLALYLRPGAGARRGQRVAEAVAWAARLGDPRGVTRVNSREVVAGALSQCGLDDRAATRVEHLSAGQRARLSLAVGLVARPEVACVDEPAAHLDARGVETLRTVVRALTDTGTAVLVATHHPGGMADLSHARLCLDEGIASVVAG